MASLAERLVEAAVLVQTRHFEPGDAVRVVGDEDVAVRRDGQRPRETGAQLDGPGVAERLVEGAVGRVALHEPLAILAAAAPCLEADDQPARGIDHDVRRRGGLLALGHDRHAPRGAERVVERARRSEAHERRVPAALAPRVRGAAGHDDPPVVQKRHRDAAGDGRRPDAELVLDPAADAEGRVRQSVRQGAEQDQRPRPAAEAGGEDPAGGVALEVVQERVGPHDGPPENPEREVVVGRVQRDDVVGRRRRRGGAQQAEHDQQHPCRGGQHTE